MPKITIDVAHALGQEKAVERLKEQFPSIRDAFQEKLTSLEETWNAHVATFRLVTQGVTVTGTVTLDPSVARVDVQLPLVAMLLKGKIESRIRQRLGEILG